jgi:acyl-CoA synthetase (AMP-forming)/AMP-acid ligase II
MTMEDSLRILPDPALTFLEVFSARATETPDETAFSEISIDGLELLEQTHTYGAIFREAEASAAVLASHGVVEGDRVLLSVASPSAFLSSFLAIQGLGAIPVPVPAESDFPKRALFASRLAAISSTCSPRALLTDAPVVADDDPPLLPPDVARLSLVDLARESLPPASFSPHRPSSGTAFLQYTSGSTGAPKGVVVTHANLVANLRAITLGARMTARDASVSWLPIFHDMGLIGGWLLNLYLHNRCYVMSPRTFVSRPDAWLRAIDHFRATFTVAPNFAYHLLAKRLPEIAIRGLSLSTLRLAFDGAEPIDPATVRAFTERFESVGFARGAFFPVYGMAECTLAAAFPEPGAVTRVDAIDRHALSRDGDAIPIDPVSPDAVCFVSVGRAVPEHRIRILATTTDVELEERQVGEVAIVGPSVSPGYFGEDGEPRAELRTGDLGYLAEGELFLVDRLKDLIIVAGRNYVPSDIERVATKIEGVKIGSVVAFATKGDAGTEELCLVVALEGGRGVDPEALRRSLRALMMETFSMAPRDICLVRKGEIPKTSSGKIQRALCRALYESGRLSLVDAA